MPDSPSTPPRSVSPIRIRTGRIRAGRVVALAALGIAVTLLATDADAARRRSRAATAPATIGSRDLKPGMKGYGLTVMRGSKIERFEIEIIGVLHNKLPGQDMILIRCKGLNLEHSGIIAGMSGSPIYVKTAAGDRLAGALSYGFPFNKDPVAGVTPIRDMLPELDRKLGPIPKNQRLLPPERARRASVDVPGFASTMRPVAVPLSVAGFHPDVLADMRKEFEPFGWTPMQASGGAPRNLPTPPMAPGGAMSLTLVRGDMNIAGIGTVTWVRGNKFIAFGHPFKGLGQIHMPVGGAHIVWVLASQVTSFKMGFPTAELGVLDQDRQPAVAGRLGPRSAMVPVTISVTRPKTKDKRVWNVEIVDEPSFFPLAAGLVVHNSLRVSAPIAQNASVRFKLHCDLPPPYAPIDIREHFVGLNGSSRMYEVRALVQRLAKAISYNGFKRVRVERIKVELEVADARSLAFIDAVRVPSHEVDVGEKVKLAVDFMVPNKGYRTIPLTLPAIPKDLAGEKVRVWIGPGSRRRKEFAPPANIDDFLTSLRHYVARDELTAVITLPDRSWMIRGHRLTELPIGVLDELNGHRRLTRRGKETIRVSKRIPWAINGNATVELKVRDPQ